MNNNDLNKELNEDVQNEQPEVVETNEQPVEETKEEKKGPKPQGGKREKKNKVEEKENWFLKVLKEEHKWETYLLGVISCVAMGLGILILTGVLQFKTGTPIFSEYSTLIGWLFTGFGLFGFGLFIIPIFKPTRKEVKQLTLPTKKVFLGNVARVFIFITILALIFVLYESVISAVLGKLL